MAGKKGQKSGGYGARPHIYPETEDTKLIRVLAPVSLLKEFKDDIKKIQAKYANILKQKTTD